MSVSRLSMLSLTENIPAGKALPVGQENVVVFFGMHTSTLQIIVKSPLSIPSRESTPICREYLCILRG